MTVIFKIVYSKDEDTVSECSIICDLTCSSHINAFI